jgi:hypothetical protein
MDENDRNCFTQILPFFFGFFFMFNSDVTFPEIISSAIHDFVQYPQNHHPYYFAGYNELVSFVGLHGHQRPIIHFFTPPFAVLPAGVTPRMGVPEPLHAGLPGAPPRVLLPPGMAPAKSL